MVKGILSKMSLAALVTHLHPIIVEFCQFYAIKSVSRFPSPLPASFAVVRESCDSWSTCDCYLMPGLLH